MYHYTLPTTVAAVLDNPDATQARANMRAALKHGGDTLRVVKAIEDYIPYSQSDHPVVWRTKSLFRSRVRLRGDLACTLVAYAMALSNFARAIITSLGPYEHERAIADAERRDKDERLHFAVTLLCRASGVFSAISDRHLVGIPALTIEVNAALAKMALADAQSLAIRKLLSKAAFDSTLAPGPPLPKSHPSTALLAKLHLDCAALYASARSLAKSNARDPGEDLLKYLDRESKFHTAIAHKWLGVDAGETTGAGKGGQAVGFLKWAHQELHDLHTPRLSLDRDQRQSKIETELKSVKAFLVHYQRINDSLTFDPVPKPSELQAWIPEGRMAVTAKEYTLPDPVSGPGMRPPHQDELEQMAECDDSSDDSDTNGTATRTYVGDGSYF